MSASSQTAEAHVKRDLVLEASNQRLVIAFYGALFNEHDLSSADRLVAADYIQHKPGVPSGRDAMLQFAGAVFKKFLKTRVSIKRSTAEGDLVYLHSHMQFTGDDPGKAVFDIFRVTDGKITEHWDVVQDVPPAPFQADSMF